MTGSRLLHINPVIGQPFEGPDTNGKHVAGRILHGVYAKGNQTPTGYTIERYPQNGRRHGGYATVPAEAVRAHLDGLAFLASIATDKE